MDNAKRFRPVVLISLDGWGIAPTSKGNAIALANTPNIKKLSISYPTAQLLASGEAVGLPHAEDGNSEVGHLNMGAGRIVYQDILRINAAIADGSFLHNPAFLLAADHAKRHNTALHLMGLISSGSVHSYLEHIYALLWFAKEAEVDGSKVFLHLFTDGRDAPPQESVTQIAEVEKRLTRIGVGKVATIAGRYYAMDRDNHWDRIEKAYNCIVLGEGEKALSATAAIEQSYSKNFTDEFIPPTNIVDATNKPVALIQDNDAVIFFNFRPDRTRQLSRVFTDANFEHIKMHAYRYNHSHAAGAYEEKFMSTFTRKKILQNIVFVTMTDYEKGLPVSAIAFPIEEIKITLARIISEKNYKQLHIAETEKYAHITYFFNGYREAPYTNEDRIEVQSPKVATYDLAPEMATPELAKILREKIKSNLYDFILINFAGPDMVGHTGVIPAAIKACEAVDKELGSIVQTIIAMGGACIITGDHGNVEEMVDLQTGQVDTEHSTNPVPFIVAAGGFENATSKLLQTGILADVAPTILQLMGISKPYEMTGRDLLAPLRLT